MSLKEHSLGPVSLNGLVLAGGKSVRMGKDKSTLIWHGKEQRYHMVDLLEQFCKNVYVSCREEQRATIDASYKTIEDTYKGLGPYGAILSAFKFNADSAWLITACDLPLLDADTLSYLVEQRDVAAMATTFESPFDGLPEPLITIWEPKSYEILLSSLSKGYQCPRKALINNNVKIIKAKNTAALMNVNTLEDYEKVQQIIKEQKTLKHAE
jgi:molybdopterin-guanine dinucleotide biosynthesis protein A